NALQSYENWLIHVGDSGPHSPGNLEFWRGEALFGGQDPAGWNFSMALTTDGGLSFGSRLGQHLSLWGDNSVSGGSYGFGVQAQTLYARCGGNGGDGFAWFKGGVHHTNRFNSG